MCFLKHSRMPTNDNTIVCTHRQLEKDVFTLVRAFLLSFLLVRRRAYVSFRLRRAIVSMRVLLCAKFVLLSMTGRE